MTRVTGLPTGTSEPAAWEGECSILVALETDSLPVKLRRRGAPARVSGAHDCQKEKLHGTVDRMSRVREGPARGIHWSEPNITVPRVNNFFFKKEGRAMRGPGRARVSTREIFLRRKRINEGDVGEAQG